MKKKYYWTILIVIGVIVFLFNPLIGISLLTIGFILGIIETEKNRMKKIISIIIFLIALFIILLLLYSLHF